MTRRFLIILCLSLLLSFMSEKTFAQQDLFNKIKKMTDSVSIENLSNHIKILEKAGGYYSRVNFTPGNDSAVLYIKKEFEKIHKRIHKKFSASNSLHLKSGETITGNVHNYFVFYASLAPLSVLWATLDDTGEPVLNIILRLKTSNNQAVLATPLYNP